MKIPRLGVNVDHVATLRQARGGHEPQPKVAALAAVRAGAEGITIHLREDRRHIQDRDVNVIKRAIRVPLNLEMADHPSIIRIALRIQPDHVCLVPEKRQELTTEGGLDVFSKEGALKRLVPRFHKRKIKVSLFIDPSMKQIKAASRIGADAVELHTGTYANAQGMKRNRELRRLRRGAKAAKELGLKVHAGHGLDYKNTQAIASIAEIEELNIGHSIVAHAVSVGLSQAVRQMKQLIRRGAKRRHK